MVKSNPYPTMVRGHPGWWRYESQSHTDYLYFDTRIIGPKARSQFFISHGRTRAHQIATGGYLYMIFEAGGGPGGRSAARRGGADTLAEAIKKAERLIRGGR
jgi:hypothetical protein